MTEIGRYRGDNDDLLKVIADLQKRISTLERATRAGNTSVGKGGTLRIRDDNGDIRVELGLLPDGTYGLRVKELDDAGFVGMPLVYSDFVSTLQQCNAGAWTDLATPGPSVQVNVGSSGRLVVFGTAWSVMAGAAAASMNIDSVIGIHLTDANTYSPNTTPGADTLSGIAKEALSSTVTSGTVNHVRNGTAVCTPVFEGLNPGLTTVTLRYGRSVTGAGSVFFANRMLTVIRL